MRVRSVKVVRFYLSLGAEVAQMVGVSQVRGTYERLVFFSLEPK